MKTGTKYVIGVDIGTTSTKSVLYTKTGSIVATHGIGYPLHSPEPSAAVQDPDEIAEAVIETISRVVEESGASPEEIACVSFSSAMHSVIAIDRNGGLLTPSITWADNRSAAWTQTIKHEWNGHAIYRRTGTPVHPMSPLSKLVWLRNDHSALFASAFKFISIKEYIFFKLFGEYVIDYSIASATGMFNLERLDWDEEALRFAGVTPDRLSKPVPTTFALTGMKESYANRMKLLPATPFVVGASDGVLSNLGVNAIEPGVVAVTIGTSGAVRAVTDRPATDRLERTFCYALTDELWVVGGAVNNGGMIFRWVRDQLGELEQAEAAKGGEDAYERLTALAGQVNPGSDGLLFHPYLSGERAPLWDANARGSYFGLNLRHQKAHMVRAALEGVIFNLHEVLGALEETIGKPKRVHATGGFAKSELWRQMMADIFDCELHVPESVESSCLGAVILGLYALGEIDSINAVSGMVGASHIHQPDGRSADMYRELVPIYRGLTQSYTTHYAAVAEFQQKWS
ncbi:gluconokinase [Paenibacillus sp. NPDC058071]|uniref:gluconokinase n=1 Tax=Paenibacillus sp. NPDC058071 TaxID=3346326 RepID=UPI0036D9C185